jgi:hypothetical protein
MISRTLFFLLVFSVFSHHVFASNTSGYSIDGKTDFDTLKMMELANKVYGSKAYKILLLRDIESGYRKIIVLNHNIPADSVLLPSADDFAGFSLNWIRESKTGFNLSFEYGTKNYYSKDFYFSYARDSFFLVKIKVQYFDMKKPEKGKNSLIWINPKLVLGKFRLEDFL